MRSSKGGMARLGDGWWRKPEIHIQWFQHGDANLKPLNIPIDLDIWCEFVKGAPLAHFHTTLRRDEGTWHKGFWLVDVGTMVERTQKPHSTWFLPWSRISGNSIQNNVFFVFFRNILSWHPYIVKFMGRFSQSIHFWSTAASGQPPYRESLLTRVLSDSFGSDEAMVVAIGTVSPSAKDTEHSIGTWDETSRICW